MKETKQDILKSFPARLEPQDRLFLEMAVTDEDTEEAHRLVGKYGLEIVDSSTPLDLCQEWVKKLKKAEKHHCQNVIDLHSQGKSIGGMQTLATSRKE